jgi:predicted exporter
MRGWKVQIEADLSKAKVGKTRGPALALQGCGWARGRRSNLHIYLVDALPEGWSEEHEQALVEQLNQDFGGQWVLLEGSRLIGRWDQLTAGEKRLLRQREGFEELASWSVPR